MILQRQRRSFLSAFGLGSLATMLLPGPRGARAEQPADQPGHRGGRKTYSGTSKKGDIEEALQLAINSAIPQGQADRLVVWSLKEITGRSGGIAGFNEVTVTIEATLS
jgi:hypothetical protein